MQNVEIYMYKKKKKKRKKITISVLFSTNRLECRLCRFATYERKRTTELGALA